MYGQYVTGNDTNTYPIMPMQTAQLFKSMRVYWHKPVFLFYMTLDF